MRSIKPDGSHVPSSAGVQLPDMSEVETVESAEDFEDLTRDLPDEITDAITSPASSRVTVMRYERLYKLVISKLESKLGPAPPPDDATGEDKSSELDTSKSSIGAHPL